MNFAAVLPKLFYYYSEFETDIRYPGGSTPKNFLVIFELFLFSLIVSISKKINFLPFHRLNLSGPACGLDCASVQASDSDQQESSEENSGAYNLLIEHQSELCETLCDVGLGV